MGIISKITKSVKQKQDKSTIQKFLKKKGEFGDLSANDLMGWLETKQGQSEFLKIRFKDVDLEIIRELFSKLNEDEIRDIIDSIDDMTGEQAYYVQAVLKDSDIREKYDEQIKSYFSNAYDKFPVEKGDYLVDTIHRYRDVMMVSTLSNFLGRIDNVDDFIKESQDSMYRYSKDKSGVIERLEEMSTKCYSEENCKAIGEFIIDNYTEYVNFHRPPLKQQRSGDFISDMDAQIANYHRRTVLTRMLEKGSYSVSGDTLNALACRYAQKAKEKGLKIEDVAFMKHLTFGDAERFFLQYKKMIKDVSGAKEILNEKLRGGLSSSKDEEDIMKFASENHLPSEIVKDVIIKRIKTPINKLKMTQSYIDSMSSEDIEEIKRSFTADEVIDNKDILEKIEVLIHVKEQQKSQGKTVVGKIKGKINSSRRPAENIEK